MLILNHRVAIAAGLAFEGRPAKVGDPERAAIADETIGWWDGEEYFSWECPQFYDDFNLAVWALNRFCVRRGEEWGIEIKMNKELGCVQLTLKFGDSAVDVVNESPAAAICRAIINLTKNL